VTVLADSSRNPAASFAPCSQRGRIFRVARVDGERFVIGVTDVGRGQGQHGIEVLTMKTLETPAPITSTKICLKNILLATDLSVSSRMALQYARALAHEHGANVHALHVGGPDEYQLLCPEAFSNTFDELPNSENGLEVLRGLLAGLPHEVPLHGSKVWEVIADVAERNEIDLVVLGTHGRKGLGKLLFGSVAEEVFRNVSCPILTVAADVEPPSLNNMGCLEMKRVVLASDLNPHSQAPAIACALCERFDAELNALHVAAIDDPPGEGTPWRQVKQAIIAAAPEILDLTCKPFFLVEYGEPAEKIRLVAEELEAGMIVLGAHHPENTSAPSHVPWAIAARVIAGARRPVLTVRDRSKPVLPV
jgi:nucleotide-binding universal stress UspA family protein